MKGFSQRNDQIRLFQKDFSDSCWMFLSDWVDGEIPGPNDGSLSRSLALTLSLSLTYIQSVMSYASILGIYFHLIKNMPLD